jgi:uncharacterized protein (UPF0276 family)
MQVGVNFTAPHAYPVVTQLLATGAASFCELLIDNFLHLAPDTIAADLAGVPLAFHIMNARFLEQEPLEMAARLRELIGALGPMYVSDHLARYTFEGRLLPVMLELDYPRVADAVARAVERWQALLGVRLLVENYPSTLPGGELQPAFYEALVRRTGCGVLFDVSNAVVAQENGRAMADDWLPLASRMDHFHVAGFSYLGTTPEIVVDSHDTALAPQTLAFLGRLKAARGTHGMTLVVERDANIEAEAWRRDLVAAHA